MKSSKEQLTTIGDLLSTRFVSNEMIGGIGFGHTGPLRIDEIRLPVFLRLHNGGRWIFLDDRLGVTHFAGEHTDTLRNRCIGNLGLRVLHVPSRLNPTSSGSSGMIERLQNAE